jgi:hypothetical protein
MESSHVILTFHTIEGKATETQTVHYAPFHYLGPFTPATIRSVKVGSDVALYGSVLKELNGIFVREYMHLREGNYIFNKPFHWLTMHADLIKK